MRQEQYNPLPQNRKNHGSFRCISKEPCWTALTSPPPFVEKKTTLHTPAQNPKHPIAGSPGEIVINGGMEKKKGAT